jgi:steroid 5-alpha reductase family enzyme
MFEIYASALPALLALTVVAWLISLVKKDVGIVDSFWSLFILLAGFVFAAQTEMTGPSVACLSLGLLLLWGLRLSGYITWRNWGKAEDHRYAAIRSKYQPNFALKSLGIIFVFQALLAWVVAMPLVVLAQSTGPVSAWVWLGAAVVLFGIIYETVADTQLARFKANPPNKGKVMDKGLWRYSRHPNYFGEFCVWWGFYVMAFAVGGWWTVPSALLMSFLLLKFSGVALLDKAMVERKPKYADYIKRTNAFFPGARK